MTSQATLNNSTHFTSFFVNELQLLLMLIFKGIDSKKQKNKTQQKNPTNLQFGPKPKRTRLRRSTTIWPEVENRARERFRYFWHIPSRYVTSVIFT